jgi:hypothetical protein
LNPLFDRSAETMIHLRLHHITTEQKEKPNRVVQATLLGYIHEKTSTRRHADNIY